MVPTPYIVPLGLIWSVLVVVLSYDVLHLGKMPGSQALTLITARPLPQEVQAHLGIQAFEDLA